MNELELINREEWERTRMIMYSVFQSQSAKQLKIKEILPFDWDNNETESLNKVTRESIEEFKKRKNIYG